MSAGVVGDHFLEELGLHTWLREWGSVDRCGGQGSRAEDHAAAEPGGAAQSEGASMWQAEGTNA